MRSHFTVQILQVFFLSRKNVKPCSIFSYSEKFLEQKEIKKQKSLSFQLKSIILPPP